MRTQPKENSKAASNSEPIPATRPTTSPKVLLAGLILAIATCLAFMPVGAFADQDAPGSSSQANSEADNQAVPQGSLMAGTLALDTALNNDAPSESGLATQANTVIASGYCGETSDYYTGEPLDGTNMTWKLYDDYTLEISGTGRMGFYNEEGSFWGMTSPVPGWYEYRESITNIAIDDGVEHIGSAAFAHTAITSITLPSSVRHIDQLAFVGCSQLEDVGLNVGLESIGVNAFKGTAITSLFIPATVKDIDNSVFRDIDVNQLVIDPLNPYFTVEDGILYGDNKTRTVASTRGFSGAYDVPSSVTTIGGGTFESRSITSVVIPNSVTTIGDGAFNISGLTSITIPDSVTKLGRSTFSNSPIVTAKIGNGLKDLGSNSAFAFNRSLKNVEFSEGLEVVSERSFGGCTALERIDLPTSVRTIEENAFNSCSALSAVTLGPNVEEIGKAAFANCPSLTSITLPDSLMTIGEGAFYGTGLTSVVVPDSVTSIGPNAFPETVAVAVPDTLVKLEDGSYVSRGSVTELNYEVTYGQTEARGMLELLNDFRSGDEAWYWSEDDTEKVQASGLDGLVYDYTLERTAMKRAAEAAILFSHTRPDGTSCFTAFEGVYSNYGENIAWGYTSAEAVMEGWKETSYSYSGQGHRRNMLSDEFNAVGIGHVVYNGMHVWVQDFGYASTPDTASTAANDSRSSASVVLKNANVTSHSDMACEPTSYTLEQGDVEALPVLTVSNVGFTVGSESGNVAEATVKSLWQSEDSSVAAVSGDNVEAYASVGNTQLVTTAFGEEVTVPVTVSRNLEHAEIILTGAQFAFTGSEITPAVSVKDGSAQLKEGVDYVVTYSDNVNAGTATVTITGVGDYGGEATVGFEIGKRKVTLTSPSASKLYDGKALTAPDVTVSGDGFAEGEVTDIKAVGSVVGTAEKGGSVRNRIVYTEGEGFLAANYDITLAEGTLTIKPLPQHTLSIKYVYADGKKAKDPYVKSYVEGAKYDVAIPAIAGYEAAVNGVKASSVKGTMGKKDVAVTVTYTLVVPSGRGVARPHRLAGDAALDTMAAIVNEGGFPVGGTVVLSTSDGYWDALTAAGIAGKTDAPVLMTNGNSLSWQTRALIQKLRPSRIIICGGTAAVTENVEAQAKAAAGGNPDVIRCAGDTATGTACKIFEEGGEISAWSNTAFVCTNAGYWDALAAAPISYANGMPIFLTEGKNSISSETLNTMKKDGIEFVYIVGGTAAISDNVRAQLDGNRIRVIGRFAGIDAIHTSQLVAEFGVDHMRMTSNNMGVATSGGYWDALAGAALCGREGSVLVLADGPSATSVTGFMKGQADKIADFYIFGGTAVVTKATENAAIAAAK